MPFGQRSILHHAMGLDGSGNVLIAGQTPATGLAVTPGAWGSSSSGPNSSFACKLSGLDGSPVFCTYLNSNRISVVAIAADAAGNSPYNGLNLTAGARFGFYVAEIRGIRKAPVPVTAVGGQTLDQYRSWSRAVAPPPGRPGTKVMRKLSYRCV